MIHEIMKSDLYLVFLITVWISAHCLHSYCKINYFSAPQPQYRDVLGKSIATMVSAYFWDKDGPYSWIILAAIALSRFVGISFALTTLGVFADTYPEHFGEEQAKTNVIGSTLLGIFLFSGKCTFSQTCGCAYYCAYRKTVD